MAAPAATEVSDGPVLSFLNKRLRAVRKKYNRILQMEETLALGKTLNKEQEDVLRSKPAVVVLIDEYEKLRQPLAAALQEELCMTAAKAPSSPVGRAEPSSDGAVEDLLNLLYFGSLFDVKPQSEFTSTMLTRTHERQCCLTYDYVTDEATDLLGERDLDLISELGGLLIARPLHSTLSHKNALRSCVEHAKLWLAKSDVPIQPGIDATYAALRERLNKIMASDYFTTTPEMKASVDVAAAAGKYSPCQAPLPESAVEEPQEEGALPEEYTQKDENLETFEDKEPAVDQPSPIDEIPKDEFDAPNEVGDMAAEPDQFTPSADMEEHDESEVETKDHVPQRAYHNQRVGIRGGGGRRAYTNGRGSRGRGGGGGNYQNGRSQYYESGNYYSRSFYNSRGRGRGRSSGGSGVYNNNGGYMQGSHASAEVQPAR